MRKLEQYQPEMRKKEIGLISVIVTVYNIREYLPKAVDSILSSTYQNLEVLLIDDGSTDGSERICDEYAKKDGRVRVVLPSSYFLTHFVKNLLMPCTTG